MYNNKKIPWEDWGGSIFYWGGSWQCPLDTPLHTTNSLIPFCFCIRMCCTEV